MIGTLKLRVKLLVALQALLLAVHLVNILLDGQLSQYGVIPRSLDSGFHIITAPFIHGSWGHLLNNLVGLSVFSAFCLLRSVRFYLLSSAFIIVLSGGLIWLFARSASHIGASGWVFGLWSLSIAMAFFDRSFTNILIALLLVFFYGGMIYGVLPADPGVSYEAHLFGVVAGVVCAFFFRVFARNELSNKVLL